jgi:hypothetical protein
VWAGAIERLVEDRSLRAALGVRGQETIHRRWTMEHSADAWIAGLRLGLLGS